MGYKFYFLASRCAGEKRIHRRDTEDTEKGCGCGWWKVMVWGEKCGCFGDGNVSSIGARRGTCAMVDENKLVSARETRLGGLSLFFLAIGLVGPFFSALAASLVNSVRSLSTVDPVAIAMCLRFSLMGIALVLGIFGRRSRAGRIGLYGSSIVLAIALALVVTFFARHEVRPVAPVSAPAVVPMPPK
jgi:hypothetical protein